MSFFRHNSECVLKKTEAKYLTSVLAIGSGYSLLGCSPAEPNSASTDMTNVQNQIAQFNLHSLHTVIFASLRLRGKIIFQPETSADVENTGNSFV